MKIIEWNCQGAFRKKGDKILALQPDILVIPECENEDKLEFGKLIPRPTDFFWYSDSGKKGLGIFSYSDYKFELLKEFNPKFRYIIPLKVTNKDGSFILFAVWAMDNKKNPEARYIAQIWLALHYYSRLLDLSSIFIGDFNSNQIWDEKDRLANHTDVVKILKRNKILSMYHEHYKVDHGKEMEHTYHMYRKKDKPYHIDYCFASADFYEDGFDISIGKPDDWLDCSDHVPIIIQINNPAKHVNFNNSLFANIKYLTDKLSPLTLEKFTSTIEKLRTKANRYDISEEYEEKMEILNALDRLLQIDRQIIELRKSGY